MKALNLSLILEKNELYSDQPWILLFEIDIDGTNYMRLAAYPEDVTWNSLTWEKFPAYIERISEAAGGRLDGLNVHVANVNRVVSAYVENANLLGRNVTVYIVHAANLDQTSDILSFTYRINRIQTTEESALFELGHEDLLSLQLPWQRYIRNKCRWIYKGSRCRYPADEFTDITRQNITDTTDGNKKNGWYATNVANAGYWNVSVTYDGHFYFSTDNTSTYTWNDSDKDGPFFYKYFVGDFVVHTYLYFVELNTECGFIAVDADDDSNWIGLVKKTPGGVATDYNRSTVNDVSSDHTRDSARLYWKMEREGDIFKLQSSALSTSWTGEEDEYTRMDIGGTVKVGFFVGNTSLDYRGVRVEYFRVDSGGLSTCDLTLDGENGCRVHHNEDNFGGFPSIPYGRLYGI